MHDIPLHRRRLAPDRHLPAPWQSVSNLLPSPCTQRGFDLAQSSTGGRLRLSEAFVERFVIQQNIEHYRALLDITSDLEQRAVFEKLLREEEAKLRKYGDDHQKK